MLIRLRKKGQSVVEFTAVIFIILGAFLVFQKYIVRGFSGRWKGIGDAMGQGKLYDPDDTIECAFDATHGIGWFDQKCYEQNCDSDCFLNYNENDCRDCIGACVLDECTE